MEKKSLLSEIVWTPWLIFAAILSGLHLIALIMAGIMAITVNWLPALYLAVLMLFLFLMWLLVFWLIFWLERKGTREGEKKHYIRRGVGTILAILMLIVCVLMLTVFDKMRSTIGKITNIPTVVTEQVNVYVLQEDEAEYLQDAGDYVFGITENYDYENTKRTIQEIDGVLDRHINTRIYESVFEMVDMLYEGKAGAIILNEAYADILETVDNYYDFKDKTRILHANIIEEDVEETPAVVETVVRDVDVTKDVFFVYLSGSDTRESRLARSRSDVNIIMAVNPVSKQILLVNTPRDYFVNISVAPEYKDKLTHCGIYGIGCSMDTLGNLYDIPLDYYAQINFTGFEKLINALGGITVYSDASFSVGSYSFKKGENKLNGEKALVFARSRHEQADGDNARGRHQMAVIQGCINKLSKSTALIEKYPDIMDSLEGMFATDVGTDDISALVRMQLSDLASWDIKSFAVTGDNGMDITYSAPGMELYVMRPHYDVVEKASSLMKKMMDGVVITDEDLK